MHISKRKSDYGEKCVRVHVPLLSYAPATHVHCKTTRNQPNTHTETQMHTHTHKRSVRSKHQCCQRAKTTAMDTSQCTTRLFGQLLNRICRNHVKKQQHKNHNTGKSNDRNTRNRTNSPTIAEKTNYGKTKQKLFRLDTSKQRQTRKRQNTRTSKSTSLRSRRAIQAVGASSRCIFAQTADRTRDERRTSVASHTRTCNEKNNRG